MGEEGLTQSRKAVKVRLADRVAAALRAEGTNFVCWGDGVLVDACGDFVSRRPAHPLNVMRAALDSCERATDLFYKHLILAHDARCRPRMVRAFQLRAFAASRETKDSPLRQSSGQASTSSGRAADGVGASPGRLWRGEGAPGL